MKKNTLISFLLFLLCGIYAYPQLKSVTAVPANDFLNSIGVNSSINSRGEKVDTTLKTCKYIGARWIRSGAPDSGEDYWRQTTIDCFEKLYNEGGIRFSFILPSEGDAHTASGINYPDGITYAIEGAKQLIERTSPDALIAFEGPNEPNNWAITYKGLRGGGSGDWKPLAEYQRDFYAAVKVDPILKDYPVWSASDMGAEVNNVGLQFLTIPDNSTLMPKGTVYADVACIHNYSIHPAWGPRSNNQTWTAADPVTKISLNSLRGNFGVTWNKKHNGYTDEQLLTLPRVTTETGATIDGSITEEIQALTHLSCYLAQYKQGFKYTAMYILRDRIDEGGNQTFGFYESHWVDEIIRYPSNPRLSAHYMHNMTTILNDNQSIQTPWVLEYNINPCPQTVHDLLLQKNDETMMLVVWGEKYAVNAEAEDVTIEFAETFSEVKIYNPAQYDVSQPDKGTLPVRIENNVNSITLSMLNHPYILEFKSTASSNDYYDIIVENGYASNDNSTVLYGMYKTDKVIEGDIVKIIAAQNLLGQQFLKWESDDVDLTNANNPVTTFNMPAKNIYVKAIYEEATSSKEVKTDNVIVTVQQGKIVFDSIYENASFSIYNIAGQLIENGQMSDKKDIVLPKGLYIVRINELSTKVFVN